MPAWYIDQEYIGFHKFWSMKQDK